MAKFDVHANAAGMEANNEGEIVVDGWLDFCEQGWFRDSKTIDSLIFDVCVEAYLEETQVSYPDGSPRPRDNMPEGAGSGEITAVEQLQRDLETALRHSTLADITLTAKDGEGRDAHSFMLAARSLVFATMFQPGVYLEGQPTIDKKRISMEHVFPNRESLDYFLEFLYTGILHPDLFMDQYEILLEAGVQYDIPSLVRGCVRALSTFIKVQTMNLEKNPK